MPEGRRGVVKWFDAKRGWGFLRVEGIEEDVFLHHTELVMPGYRQVLEGQAVLLGDLIRQDGGLRAVRVTPGDGGTLRVCPKCRAEFVEPVEETR
jgi:CspA family cold shock protein